MTAILFARQNKLRINKSKDQLTCSGPKKKEKKDSNSYGGDYFRGTGK